MTAPLPFLAPPWGRRCGASTCVLPVADLERFWPSRRAHAFDERCR